MKKQQQIENVLCIIYWRSAQFESQLDSSHGTGTWTLASIKMAELTYRGLKYTQTKSAKGSQEVHLQYCGHEIMSKRIHEAMKAEMGWKLFKKIIFSS